MTNEERIAKLEAQVLAQQSLLLALTWKLANSAEPVSRLFNRNYAEIAKHLNSAQPPQTEAANDLGLAVKALSYKLPSNI